MHKDKMHSLSVWLSLSLTNKDPENQTRLDHLPCWEQQEVEISTLLKAC